MPRKKKETVKESFIPSKYQQAIFDYIKKGNGHLVVEAAAGSGKTSTLVKSLEFIPKDKKILLTAFNSVIVGELAKRTKEYTNIDARTLHKLGLDIIKANYRNRNIAVEQFKYDSYIKNNIEFYTTINFNKLKPKEQTRYTDNIKKYVDFGRFYMCQTVKDLELIENRYDIDTIADEKEIAIRIMEWGKGAIDSVDFADMIWLPNVLYLKPIGALYDFIMVDECQDMNKAERELVLKCFKMGTRLISVGDTQQMLYSFAGGDPESFNALKALPNTECLPLSISYRCARNIVEFAQQLVPSIEANNDGREGEILYDVSLKSVNDGDMVLCRNNAPLVQVYNWFLKLGKKSFIRGKELGYNLKRIINATSKQELNIDCKKDGVFARLYYDLFMSRNRMMDRYELDEETVMRTQYMINRIDTIKTVEILSEGCTTADEVIAKIEDIFDKNKKDGIALSTVHKAKGLESDNVYIVCPQLMPSKSATKDWEIKQEYNLMYVAYTRAKNRLGFIDDKEMDDFDYSSTKNKTILKNIELLVNKTLNKSTQIVINETIAKDIVERAKPITKSVLTSTTININNSNGKRNINSFSDILKNKKIKAQKRKNG